MSFLQKPDSPEQIKARLDRERQAKILRDYDNYGELYAIQRMYINFQHDLSDALLTAKRITIQQHTNRKAAIDQIASKFYMEYQQALSAAHTLWQLRVMTANLNEQIEKE